MTKLINAKLLRSLSLLICFIALCFLPACGGSKDTADAGTNTDPTTTAASIDLSASPTSIKSNGAITTITVNALNSNNAAISVPVTMGCDTGIVDPAVVTTPGTATFSAGGNKTNRNATITATATGGASAQIHVQIVGTTVALSATGTDLPNDGSLSITLTVTVTDAGGNAAPNTPVTLTSTGTGSVTITNILPSSGQTDDLGVLTARITGTGAGTVTVSATALGSTGTKNFNVGTTSSVFSIDNQWLNGNPIGNPNPSAMKIGDALTIRVNVPTSVPAITNVMFSTSIGSWVTPMPVSVSGGYATAILNTAQAGTATVQAYNWPGMSPSDTLTVYMASGNPADHIYLQVTPTTIPKKVGTTTGSSTLIATVYDSLGYPVGDAPVLFSIVNPIFGGETVSPAVMATAATATGGVGLGEARSTFTSGTSSSTGTGVYIRASVVGTTVSTGSGTTPPSAGSGPDQPIVIGGTAGSVAFGQATVIMENDNKTEYILPMSVLVADAAGKPVAAGTPVTVTAWPVAFSTGTFCTPDEDGCRYNYYGGTCVPGNYGTFFGEDLNENMFLDPGEDGARTYYYNPSTPVPGTGTADGYLTPTNSAGGAVSSGSVTDTYGVATFTLTYPKTSAMYIITRVRASTIVQGSETVGQTIFRLPAMLGDVTYFDGGGVKTCKLPASTFGF